MSLVYQPSTTLTAKISRRITPFMSRRMQDMDLTRPLVSFTFDDCPKSAIENGVMPLEKEGWKSSVYVAGGLLRKSNHHGLQISERDVQDLHVSGHEIGGHTWSHIDAQSIDPLAFIDDIDRNQDYMRGLGLPTFRTFAYPYGQTQPALKRMLQIRFDGMRGISPGFHKKDVDLNQIRSMPLFSGTALNAALKTVSSLLNRPAWVTFFTHDIREDHSPWGCTPSEFSAVIKAVKDIGADVLPVDQAIDVIKAGS